MLFNRQQLDSFIGQDSDERYFACYDGFRLLSLFQPIFSSRKKILGYEALVRIFNKEGNLIRANELFQDPLVSFEFKGVIEKLSRIIHIRNFAHSPIREGRLFINTLPKANEIFLSNAENTKELMDSLEELEIKPSQIVIELIELNAKDDIQLQKSIQHLRSLGFTIAIDDFGIAASNPNRVHLIQPNIVKLDKSLLQQYSLGNKQEMLDALALCSKINAQTVIEGIESEEQFIDLTQLDIGMYQGFHLAEPKPLEVKRFVSNKQTVTV